MSDSQPPFDERELALGLLEAAPDAILVVRPNGTIALVNRMTERMFGWDRAELVGRSVDMLVPDAIRPAHAEHRERYARAPKTRTMGDLAALDGLRKNGERVPIDISLSPVATSAGRLTIVIVRDVTRRRELEEQLRFASTHDSLTGLYNRTYLDAARAALDTDALPIGVILCDVDGLKGVNDELGHEAGDQMLKRCAVVLRSASEATSIVARLGGDEFAVIMPSTSVSSVARTVDRIRDDLVRHNEVTRGPRLAISIGSALAEKRGQLAQAMRLADRRMYEEKRRRPARTADRASR